MIHHSKIEKSEQVEQPDSAITIFEGARIATPIGEICIEDLRSGDIVCTENGNKPIAAILKQNIGALENLSVPAQWPVLIAAGALGFGLPKRDVLFHKAQQILLHHERVQLAFGEDAILIDAASLSKVFKGVFRKTLHGHASCYQILFEDQEIIFAEGVPISNYLPDGQELIQGNAGETEALLGLVPQLEIPKAAQHCGYRLLSSWELMAAIA